MSASSEYKLAQTIIWSNRKYLLKEFVQSFTLPQVVLVKDGYCGEDERTTFGRDQILTLHQLRETNTIVCQTAKERFILLPSKCEVKAQVLSMNFNDVSMTMKQLIETYKKIKYVRVVEVGENWSDDPKSSLEENDTLEIKKIEQNSAGFRCKNLSANHDAFILSNDLAKFVPLSDPKYYTLAEIKTKFGFPAKIWFTDEGNNDVTFSSPDSRHSKTNLCKLERLTVVEEIQESDLIVTTVCSNLEEKVCLNVPTELNIKVTVAEGFLKGSKTYATVVKTLDKELYKTDLKAFKDLDVYEHVHAVKKHMQDNTVIIGRASSKVAEHARQQLQKHEKTKSDRAPKAQPRSSSMSGNKTPPNVAPMLKPKKSTKSENLPILQDEDNYTSLDPTYSSVNDAYEPLQPVSGSLINIKQGQNTKPGKETNSEDRKYAVLEKDSSEDKHSYDYIEPERLRKTDTPPRVPKKPKNLEMRRQRTETDGAQKNQRKPSILQESHVRRKTHGSRSDIQKIPLPPLPSLPPLPKKFPKVIPPNPPKEDDKTIAHKNALTTYTPDDNDKEAIYEAVSRYPQDLSSLTIADVSQLLNYLGLKGHVETFKNEMIDGSMLITMDEESLEFLNVKPFYINKLMRFIGGWRPNVGK